MNLVQGQRRLQVKFQESLIRVPFRIRAQGEEKLLGETSTTQKQVEEALRKKG